MLEIAGLQKSLALRPVLCGVDLRVRAGEWVGLVGANGSGKSTLMRCIAGLLPADQGQIRIAGHDLRTAPLEARAAFGYAVPPAQLPEVLSGRQCLELVARARGLQGVDEAVWALAEALGFMAWAQRPVLQYSLGTRQKLAVLCALLGEPPLLLLDEVLNGLDLVSALALKEHLRVLCRTRGTAVLLATHALDGAELFLDRVVVLRQGRIRVQMSADALCKARSQPGFSLERALVEALRQVPEED